ncbi:MAG TPA: hypothetical protein VFJ94_01780 [Intrasporangium sp.]|uniref:hypothetical protein n=1 Tax=Intrasporangium sp. TaxID=1925024 RepID=UPI002D7946AC|nr:hypothetical protein [Intrasporangium sp.]HET7397224.1 hypothetical protein [Intrasporangium sp.]
MRDDTVASPGAQESSEAPDAGHETVSIDAPVEQVWEHLISRPGAEFLIGPEGGGPDQLWPSTGGAHDTSRGSAPAWGIRLSWRPDDDAPPALVDVSLRPDGAGTRVDLVHEGAGSTRLWRNALDRLLSSFDSAGRTRTLVGRTPEPDPTRADGLEARRRKLLAHLDAMGPLDKHAV